MQRLIRIVGMLAFPLAMTIALAAQDPAAAPRLRGEASSSRRRT